MVYWYEGGTTRLEIRRSVPGPSGDSDRGIKWFEKGLFCFEFDIGFGLW